MKHSASLFRIRILTTLTTVFAALSSTDVLLAQDMTTTPVGFVTITCKENSDTHVAIPLARSATFRGTVVSVSGQTVGVSGGTFADNQFQYAPGAQPEHYYVQFTSGQAVGRYADILANSADALDTDLPTADAALIQAGDSIVIRPHWTLGTLFPASEEGVGFIASTNNLQSGRRTEILIPDTAGAGINKAPVATWFYNGFWRKVGAVGVNGNDTILPAGSSVIVRGNNYADDTFLIVAADVLEHAQAVTLRTAAGGQNDNPVGPPLPVGVALQSLGLVGESGAFVVSTNNLTSGRGDELLVYDNTVALKNKTPSATYFYNGFWRKVGETTTNQNETIIPAASALVIRKKAQTPAGQTAWLVPSVIE
ncbi:TIGR02597 family protein [Opitutaceae bacterium TAV3]|nr:TIGR02597 family protein [Opitutaceae bacterium TAV3]